jgi:hypothetical protein
MSPRAESRAGLSAAGATALITLPGAVDGTAIPLPVDLSQM